MNGNSNRQCECQKKSHLRWIDAAKGVAIIAVIIDHSTGILFSNRIISLCSYFSVTVFVFLAGITSYYSSERHQKENIQNEIIRKAKSIIFPYAIATCVYQLVIDKRWEVSEYIRHLLQFDITPPFYFIVFYIQLIIISPYIYRLLNRWKGKKEKYIHCIMVVLSVFISVLCIRYTFILDVWGGGKYLLGGSYLIVYFLGEISAHYGAFLRTSKNLLKMLISIFVVFMCMVWLVKYEFRLDVWLDEPFGPGLNPPGITLMIYGVCIVLLLYYIFSYAEITNIRLIKGVYMIISYIGHYSLYIFLYHKLVLDHLLINFYISNIWMKRVVYIFTMLGIPILFKVIIEKVKQYMEQ